MLVSHGFIPLELKLLCQGDASKHPGVLPFAEGDPTQSPITELLQYPMFLHLAYVRLSKTLTLNSDMKSKIWTEDII